MLFVGAAVVVCCDCASAQVQKYDSHVAMEFKESPAVVCDNTPKYDPVAVGWTGKGAAPTDDPPDVLWQSADTTVVKVSSQGELQPQKTGNTTVTVFAYWGKLVGRKELPVQVIHCP